MTENPYVVLESIVHKALEESPQLMIKACGYADFITRRMLMDQVTAKIALELSGRGFLPYSFKDEPRELPNFHAVAFTMKNMRSRLLRYVRTGDREAEAEASAMRSIAVDFFADLESQGWRLVYTRKPTEHHSTPYPHGKTG